MINPKFLIFTVSCGKKLYTSMYVLFIYYLLKATRGNKVLYMIKGKLIRLFAFVSWEPLKATRGNKVLYMIKGKLICLFAFVSWEPLKVKSYIGQKVRPRNSWFCSVQDFKRPKSHPTPINSF